MERRTITVKMWSEHGFELTKAYQGDSGFDIVASHDVLIEPGAVCVVGTGIYLEIPEGFECQVRSRSGLAAKHGVFVLNSPGTIDATYRGECKVILANLSKTPYAVRRGERIAQLVFAEIPAVNIKVETDKGMLSPSPRDDNGFGSTGRTTIQKSS